MRTVQLVYCEDCPKREACNTEEDICRIVKLVDRSTRASGVPYYVEDPATTAKIARLINNA